MLDVNNEEKKPDQNFIYFLIREFFFRERKSRKPKMKFLFSIRVGRKKKPQIKKRKKIFAVNKTTRKKRRKKNRTILKHNDDDDDDDQQRATYMYFENDFIGLWLQLGNVSIFLAFRL